MDKCKIIDNFLIILILSPIQNLKILILTTNKLQINYK